MRTFVGLHKYTISPPQSYEDIHRAKEAYFPPQSYEDIRRTTQAYCLDITHKTLQHHHLNYMRIFVGLYKSTVLILLTRLENDS